MEFKYNETINEWDKWKEALAKAVNFGEKIGFSDETIEKIGYKIGNFLSEKVDPENREQRLLQELWKSGNNEDKKALTGMIANMVQSGDKH